MEQSKKINPYLIGGGALAALSVAFLVTRGMGGGEHGETAPSAQQAVVAEAPVARPALPKDVRFKVPVSTLQPSEGPTDALVTLVEWCDLRGEACRSGDRVLKEVLKEYDGKLRRVYRLMPNISRAEESRQILQFARAAYEDGKNSQRFIDVRSQIMAIPDAQTIGETELRAIAKKTGVDYDKLAPQIQQGFYMTSLGLDANFAARFGIQQLPAVFVNGRPVPAGSSWNEYKVSLKALVDEELANAERALASGVEKARLYDKIIDDGLWSTDDSPAKRQAAAAAKTKAALPNFGAAAGKP